MTYFDYYEEQYRRILEERCIREEESKRRHLEEERRQREKKREVQRKYEIFQRAVDRCIAEGRDFTPLSIIWHEHWLDGFEGDVVFPEVEELPFEDDDELSDDDISDADSSLILVDEVPEIKEAHVDTRVEKVVETVDIGDEEPHVAPFEPPLVCVGPDFSLQVPTTRDALVREGAEPMHLVGEIGTVVTTAGSIVHLKDIPSSHIYHDPFLVHCSPFDFVIADFYAAPIHLCKRMLHDLFTSLCFLVVRHYEGLLTYVRPRLLFDPGGFEDESFRTGRE